MTNNRIWFVLAALSVLSFGALSGCTVTQSMSFDAMTEYNGALYVAGHTQETDRAWLLRCVPPEDDPTHLECSVAMDETVLNVAIGSVLGELPDGVLRAGDPDPLEGGRISHERACESGNGYSCALLGGREFQQLDGNHGVGCTYFEQACALGYHDGCVGWNRNCSSDE